MSEQPHLAFARDRIIIMSAPNGARRNKLDHPALPMTPEELAAEAGALLDVGVAVMHLHVRGNDGRHTLDAEAYRAAIDAIHRQVGDELVIQVTTEAVGMYQPEQQMAVVRELRPEAVSLALNELCPDPSHERDAAAFFEWLQGEGIWPQYILYSPQELDRFDRLRKKGFFSHDAPFCMLVLGSYLSRTDGNVEHLEAFLNSVDCAHFPWAVCCFGPNENAVMRTAWRVGGHARLGFENNLWLSDGQLAVNNAELVEALRKGMANSVRRPASAFDVRGMFGNRS